MQSETMNALQDTIFMWQVIAALLLCLLILVAYSYLKLLDDYNDVAKSRNSILRDSNKKSKDIVYLQKQIKDLSNG